MQKYNSIISIIIGFLVAVVLIFFLPTIPFLIYLVFILSGFITTFLSRTNKAILGFYGGAFYSVGCLPTMIIFNELTSINIARLLLLPLLGLIGGFIAESLRERYNNDKTRTLNEMEE